jgi:membrane-associated HD superfamily phosphohydrolase
MSNKVLSREVHKLRLEKIQLERDEEKLKNIIDKVKQQINAIEIEQLELKNRQPLSDNLIQELLSETIQQQGEQPATQILEQMVLGNFEPLENSS